MLRRIRTCNRCIAIFAVCTYCQLTLAQSPDEERLRTQQGAINIQDDGMVEMHVVDMPLTTALRMLNVRSRKNIIATPSVQGTVTADLYQFTFEKALRAILTANDCDYIVRDDIIYVYTIKELASILQVKKEINHKMFRLNYVSSYDMENIIAPLLSEAGQVSTSSKFFPEIDEKDIKMLGNTLAGQEFIVVYDYLENLKEISDLIQEVDIKPKQVLVEATILRARLTEDNALGIDFTLLGGVQLELLGATSNGVADVTLGQLPMNRFDSFNSNASTNFTSNVPDGGLSIGIIKNHVAVFLRALEKITDTSVLANPKILVLNKQVGNIIVGRRDGYLTTTVTETSAIQKVEFLETGTQLTFRPFIGSDGFVRMELHPKDSVGGLTPAQLPFEQTTEVTTTVFIKDGHTILIGGLFREVDTDSRSQVPFLGNIPWVGNLFRSRNDAVEREEVIILLTVKIIDNDEVYAQNSYDQMEDLERMRVGLRRGMMWHGRNRIAQSYYRKAVQLMSRGDSEKASWYAKLVLHNQPRFLPAIKLVEEIEQSREWDHDGGLTRSFLWELMMQDDYRPARFGRPDGLPGSDILNGDVDD